MFFAVIGQCRKEYFKFHNHKFVERQNITSQTQYITHYIHLNTLQYNFVDVKIQSSTIACSMNTDSINSNMFILSLSLYTIDKAKM